jgi:hypothetical protein
MWTFLNTYQLRFFPEGGAEGLSTIYQKAMKNTAVTGDKPTAIWS